LGKTISEKILSAHSGVDAHAGQIVVAQLDFMMGQDGTSPLAIEAFREMGASRVSDPAKVAMVIDHSAPSPLEGVSRLHALMREFAREQGITFYDIGQGVCHCLIPERGHLSPGDLMVGADSHTCTYGAVNVFATGVGSTDLAAAMMTGKLWFKVPQTIRIVLDGALNQGVYSKDLALWLAGKLTADGATYMAIEYVGEAIDDMSVEARFTLSNMAVELGAKAGLMRADAKTLEWMREHGAKKLERVESDADAFFVETLEYRVHEVEPMVAKPHTVDNVATVSEVAGTHIDQGVLGTCTNGRVEDLEIAASILRGRQVHPDVRLVVAPASQRVLLEAMDRGIIRDLVEAGAALVTPGCGPCVGTHNGVPGDGENVISTANRNFKGRMGNPNAFIYLASPATVAASVIEGSITDPRRYLNA